MICLVPRLDKVGDAAERHSRRCHCRSLQSQPQPGTRNRRSRLRGSAGLRLRYRAPLLPQSWQTAESFFQKVSASTLRPDKLPGKVPVRSSTLVHSTSLRDDCHFPFLSRRTAYRVPRPESRVSRFECVTARILKRSCALNC